MCPTRHSLCIQESSERMAIVVDIEQAAHPEKAVADLMTTLSVLIR